MLNLGLNDESINYEVAKEILGQSLQPFMTAITEEKKKENPSLAFIAYCEARIDAIDDLQDDLRLVDTDTINRILSKEDPVFRR